MLLIVYSCPLGNLSCSLCNLIIVYRMQFYCHGRLPLLRSLFNSAILYIYIYIHCMQCLIVLSCLCNCYLVISACNFLSVNAYYCHRVHTHSQLNIHSYTICSPSSSARRRNFRSRTSERIYHRFRRRGRRRVDVGFSWAAGVYWTARLLNRTSTEPHVYWTARLLNHTSPTVGLLRHSHTFSHRTNWTILFAIWSCPTAKQSYCDQDLNNGISREKCPNFLVSQSSSAFGAFLQKGRWPCVLLRCRRPDECPRNQTWPARMATVYRLFETESEVRRCCIMETNIHPFQSDTLSKWKKPTKT